jgi:flagella basal body P-ring formation protein FlgA
MTLRTVASFISMAFTAGVQAAPAVNQSVAVIEIRAVVELEPSKQEITLGDLVELHNMSEAKARMIRGVRLADAPKAGEVRTFTEIGLQQILRSSLREAGVGTEAVLRIPSRVTIARRTFHLSASDIEANLKLQFRPLCEDCEFEISGLSVPAIGERIAAGSTWKIRTRAELPRGSFSYPLEINNEDGTRRTFWVGGTLIVRRSVPVAGRMLGIGEKIGAEDFSIQKREVTFATDSIASASDIGFSVVARQIAGGQVIWRSNLRRELAVKLGDSVKVMIGTDAWVITADGVAQGSGYVGDLIKVKIPHTQKMVSGLLREKGLVEVQ